MNGAWLARFWFGLVWTIMDDLPNEKAPGQRLRGAFVDWLGLILEEEEASKNQIESVT